MDSYDFLLAISIILIFTKAFGLFTERLNLPQVVGAIIAGIILGPSFLGILKETDFIIKSGEIGVIMLMFMAGIDTDLRELKKMGFMAFFIAIMGVIVTFLGCFVVYYLFFEDSFTAENVMRASFIAVVFVSTSVSITIETLNEGGKLRTKVGNAIVGAAIIDDILGIVVLSFMSGFVKSGVNQFVVLAKIVSFFLFMLVIGLAARHIFDFVGRNHEKSKRVAVWALAFCFLMSYSAEKFFGVADITGAYFAGLILCNLGITRNTIAKRIAVSAYIFFTPVFFAGIGIKTSMVGMTPHIILFAAVLLLTAILTKLIGCGLSAKLFKMTNRQALGIGIGMVSRGEVSLMIAQRGISLGLITPEVFPAIILVVIMTSLLTPSMLSLIMKNYHEEAIA